MKTQPVFEIWQIVLKYGKLAKSGNCGKRHANVKTKIVLHLTRQAIGE